VRNGFEGVGGEYENGSDQIIVRASGPLGIEVAVTDWVSNSQVATLRRHSTGLYFCLKRTDPRLQFLQFLADAEGSRYAWNGTKLFRYQEGAGCDAGRAKINGLEICGEKR
jgi:hypothetical protein